MRNWRRFLPLLILCGLSYLYFDERQFVRKARPAGFSTVSPAGSTFLVRLQRTLDLRKVHAGQKVCFIPVESLPHGSTADASLPTDAVLEGRVKRVLNRSQGRRTVVFEFERLRVGGRVVPLSAFLTVKEDKQTRRAEDSQRETRGAVSDLIARSARGNPLVIMAGYLSGTYLADFLSRRTDVPTSFFSNERGQTVPTSTELQIQLHRRAYVPR